MHDHQGLPPRSAASTPTGYAPSTAPRPVSRSLDTALPADVRITHSSRFSVPVSGEAPLQVRSVIRNVLPLTLGVSDQALRTRRYVEACFAELVEAACARTGDEHLLCEVRVDAEHVFIAVDHASTALAGALHSAGPGLVESLADDHGSHVDDAVHHVWAAVRRF